MKRVDRPIGPQHRATLPISASGLSVWLLPAMLLGLFLYQFWASYQSAERAAEISAGTLAEMVSGRFENCLKRAHSDVSGFAAWLRPEDLRGPISDNRRSDIENMMNDHLRRFPEVITYRVFNAEGRSVAGAGSANPPMAISVSDRDWFRQLQEAPERSLVVSEVLTAHGSPAKTIILAIPVRDRDRQLLGVVNAAINLSFFERQVAALSVGDHGLVTVRRTDNFNRVLRVPPLPDPLDKPITEGPLWREVTAGQASGQVTVLSPVDQRRRITAFRSLTNYPLTVMVGLATEDALATWRRQSTMSGLAALLLIGALAALYRRQRTNSGLRASESFRGAILNALPSQIAVLDRHGRILAVNQAWISLGLAQGRAAGAVSPAGDIGVNYVEVCDLASGADPSAAAAAQGIRAVLGGQAPTYRLEYPCPDEHGMRWFQMVVTPLGRRKRDGAVVVRTDITEQRVTTDELRVAAAAFDSQEGILVADAHGKVLRINRAFSEQTGYSPADLVGRTYSLFASDRHAAGYSREMLDSINRQGGWQGEIWDRRKNGEAYANWLTISAVTGEDGKVSHYVATHKDITERKKSQEKIQELAFFDQLTGLPNRTLLLERLEQSIKESLDSGQYGALLFIDLDNFKTLNDTLGHDVGDALLRLVARRLTDCLTEKDTVARLGGDEFLLLLSGLGASREAATGAVTLQSDRILRALNEPYRIQEALHHCSPSIGATVFQGAVTTERLLKQADLAMYRSKAAGRNTIRFYDPEMERAVIARAVLERDLRDALHKKQFFLHYQPQIGENQQIDGAEVLLRWQHPRRGLVPPVEFIALAEDTGMIIGLGHWVLQMACRQLAAWAKQPDLAHMTIAVNVSARQFRQPGFVDEVLTVLSETGADPTHLKLELTETLLADNLEDVVEKMAALKKSGVGFALDDFGTGYSSLSYLKRLPLDQLKIDQSFVQDIMSDPNDAAIAKTIVALAHSLGLAVIAEGVETVEQRDYLARAGCPAYQGYYFSRPVSLEQLESLARQSALEHQEAI